MTENRLDPLQFLQQIEKSEKRRGKLKIFFGACAGVGKTYAMLSAALEKYREHVDVVIGVVETHGRTEIVKLIDTLPILPLQQIEYHGITLKEFDLDAAIARRPDILLVDELAHTNPPSTRHPKRWQDIREILEQGIDVYTTLNVQHIESLNDVVADLTGIRVKETLPDSVFDEADEIVLVDAPSEVILERLQEGKVYLGEFAKRRASQNFFKIENLISLREIALRRTAERVDALHSLYKKYQSKQKQAVADKILVCVGPGLISIKLIRTAKQLASKLKAPWTALYVENLSHETLDENAKALIQKNLSLAEQLGANVQRIHEVNITETIMNYAKENGFTKLILGKPSRPRWKRLFFASPTINIIESSKSFDIYIIGDNNVEKVPLKRTSTSTSWKNYLSAVFIIAICTLINLPFKDILGKENIVMIYLVGIVIIGATSERRVAAVSAILSVVCYHLFFTMPTSSLRSFHFQDIITLSVLLFAGLVVSSQTSMLRLQKIHALKREKFTNELYKLSHKLIATKGKHKIAKVIVQHINEIFDCSTTVWLPDEKNQLQLASQPEVKPDIKEDSVIHWVFTHNQSAGIGTNTMPSAKGYYIPLTNGQTILGVLGVVPKNPDKILSSEEMMMLEALAFQAVSALERVK